MNNFWDMPDEDKQKYLANLPRAKNNFWNLVDKSDSCWCWSGCKSKNGYGSFSVYVNGKSMTLKAHRFSYMLNVGIIPPDMCVCHRCDNRVCVRPDHLFIGTKLDNYIDMVQKGRVVRVRGEAINSAKLKDVDIQPIRDLVANGVSRKSVSIKFSVSPTTIERIIRGETWTHL